MNFHIVTIFPKIFQSYFGESIIGRAREKGLVNIKIYDLRDFADKKDKRRTVDDTPYGGGPGMVLMVEPIYKCVRAIKAEIENRYQKGKAKTKPKILVLLTSAKGDLYNQAKAMKIKRSYTDVIIICGRYEGVDERVAKYIADEEISVGRYILTGGELPAMIIVDSVSRLVDGVLGNRESLTSESFGNGDNRSDSDFDYPVYTRPAVFKGWKVPDVLLSGNHKKIEEWRRKQRRQFDS